MLSLIELDRILLDLPDTRVIDHKDDYILLGEYDDEELEKITIAHVTGDLSDADYPGVIILEMDSTLLNSDQFLNIAKVAFHLVVTG